MPKAVTLMVVREACHYKRVSRETLKFQNKFLNFFLIRFFLMLDNFPGNNTLGTRKIPDR